MPLADAPAVSLLAAAAMLACSLFAQAQKPVPPPLAPNPFCGSAPSAAARSGQPTTPSASPSPRCCSGSSRASPRPLGLQRGRPRKRGVLGDQLGQADIGFTQVDIAVNAVDGSRATTPWARSTSGLWSGHAPQPPATATTSCSGIRTMAELRGKRVSTGVLLAPPSMLGDAWAAPPSPAWTATATSPASSARAWPTACRAEGMRWTQKSVRTAGEVTSLGANAPGAEPALANMPWRWQTGSSPATARFIFPATRPACTNPAQEDYIMSTFIDNATVSSAMPDARVTAILLAAVGATGPASRRIRRRPLRRRLAAHRSRRRARTPAAAGFQGVRRTAG